MKRLWWVFFVGVMLLGFPVIGGAVTVRLAWDYQQQCTDTTTCSLATGFKIFRQVNCAGEFVAFPVLPLSQQVYDDTDLQVGVTYCYKVVAVDTDQVSIESEAPTNVRATFVRTGGAVDHSQHKHTAVQTGLVFFTSTCTGEDSGGDSGGGGSGDDDEEEVVVCIGSFCMIQPADCGGD